MLTITTQMQLKVSENRRGNQEWTIQRHWQHRPHKTQDPIISQLRGCIAEQIKFLLPIFTILLNNHKMSVV